MKFLGLIGLLLVAQHVLAIPASRNNHRDHRYHAGDKLGAVASETAICSRVGIDLLKAGGNAADAVSGVVCTAHNSPFRRTNFMPLISRSRSLSALFFALAWLVRHSVVGFEAQ
jgi:hypothetical protein